MNQFDENVTAIISMKSLASRGQRERAPASHLQGAQRMTDRQTDRHAKEISIAALDMGIIKSEEKGESSKGWIC